MPPWFKISGFGWGLTFAPSPRSVGGSNQPDLDYWIAARRAAIFVPGCLISIAARPASRGEKRRVLSRRSAGRFGCRGPVWSAERRSPAPLASVTGLGGRGAILVLNRDEFLRPFRCRAEAPAGHLAGRRQRFGLCPWDANDETPDRSPYSAEPWWLGSACWALSRPNANWPLRPLRRRQPSIRLRRTDRPSPNPGSRPRCRRAMPIQRRRRAMPTRPAAPRSLRRRSVCFQSLDGHGRRARGCRAPADTRAASCGGKRAGRGSRKFAPSIVRGHRVAPHRSSRIAGRLCRAVAGLGPPCAESNRDRWRRRVRAHSAAGALCRYGRQPISVPAGRTVSVPGRRSLRSASRADQWFPPRGGISCGRAAPPPPAAGRYPATERHPSAVRPPAELPHDDTLRAIPRESELARSGRSTWSRPVPAAGNSTARRRRR